MQKMMFCLIITVTFLISGFIASAQSSAPNLNTAQQPPLSPSPAHLNVKAYVLIDVNSGTLIAEKNMDQRLAPASLTKLMVLYLTSRALAKGVIQLDDNVLISKKAWRTGGSRMFVKVNTNVPVKDLVQGMIVDSGNDATMALAQYLGGSESTFVDMMNQEVHTLGMKNTHYTNPTGLPAAKHYSTALDLAKLARMTWIDFPQYQHWYKQKWLKYNGIRQPNTNRLLWRYPYALGMKTGHTNDAGYCLVAVAKKGDTTLISVVMGAPTDEASSSDSIRLLSYGFRFYSSHLLYQANSVIAKPRIWFGKNKTIPAGSTHDVYVTIPHGQFQNAKVNFELNNDLQAPIKKGQTLGNIVITLNKKPIAQYPIIALASDPKGGLWRRLIDSVDYKFYKWFGRGENKKSASPQAKTTSATNTT